MDMVSDRGRWNCLAVAQANGDRMIQVEFGGVFVRLDFGGAIVNV